MDKVISLIQEHWHRKFLDEPISAASRNIYCRLTREIIGTAQTVICVRKIRHCRLKCWAL